MLLLNTLQILSIFSNLSKKYMYILLLDLYFILFQTFWGGRLIEGQAGRVGSCQARAGGSSFQPPRGEEEYTGLPGGQGVQYCCSGGWI